MITVSYKQFLVLFGIMKVLDGFAQYNLKTYIGESKNYTEGDGVSKAFLFSSAVTIIYGLLMLIFLVGVLKTVSRNVPSIEILFSTLPAFILISISIGVKFMFSRDKIKLKSE